LGKEEEGGDAGAGEAGAEVDWPRVTVANEAPKIKRIQRAKFLRVIRRDFCNGRANTLASMVSPEAVRKCDVPRQKPCGLQRTNIEMPVDAGWTSERLENRDMAGWVS
jgi:hypothetical protein